MSVQAVPESVSSVLLSEAASALRDTVAGMEDDVRERFMQDLMEAIYAHHELGDERRLERVTKGLLISTRLHARGDYQAALAAAETEPWEPGVDVAQYLSDLHESRTRS